MNFYFVNELVKFAQPLNTTAIDGLEMTMFIEDGRGYIREDTNEPYGHGISTAHVVMNDSGIGDNNLVAIVHPSHIIDDAKRLDWFTTIITNGVRIACLTTGEVFQPTTDLDEATKMYTRWYEEANKVNPVTLFIY